MPHSLPPTTKIASEETCKIKELHAVSSGMETSTSKPAHLPITVPLLNDKGQEVPLDTLKQHVEYEPIIYHHTDHRYAACFFIFLALTVNEFYRRIVRKVFHQLSGEIEVEPFVQGTTNKCEFFFFFFVFWLFVLLACVLPSVDNSISSVQGQPQERCTRGQGY